MVDRSIVVRLRAQVDGFKSEMAAAAKATEQVGKASEDAAKRADTATGRLVQSANANRAAWDTAGGALTGFGAATLGALGLATKAAMDWESAWAGVTKTVDGTPQQYAELEEQLRGLATTLPATHEEIAGVAEAAGQLGVAREDIASFTETMINLGETTNLTADEAATAIAQFSNVMKVSANDTGRFAASLVDLGNKGASTERDILMMAQRLSSTGALIGASSQDILGLSSALSDVGISAEAGGGSISRVLQDINTAVLDGGESLEGFAQVAGVSADEFAAKWKSSPVEAFALFTRGLQGITDSGGNAIQTLSDLGIKSSEETRSVMSLASNTDGLTASIETANQAWADGTAAVDEAAKRYETAESRIKIAGNQLTDFAIDIGGVVLPAFADLVEKGADAVGWIQGLPEPVVQAGTAIAGLAGAGALGAGGLLLLVPRLLDTVDAFRQLNDAHPGVASGLGKVGKAAGIAAAAFVVLQAASGLADSFAEDAQSADQIAASLMNLAGTTGVTAASIDEMAKRTGTGGASVDDFGDAIDTINYSGFLKGLDTVGSAFGLFDSDVSIAQEQLAGFDQALTAMLDAGSADELAESFKAAADSASEYGYSAGDVIEAMPALKTALTEQATAMGLTADNATLAKIAMGEIKPAAEGAADGAEGLTQATVDGTDAAEEHKKAIEAEIDAVNGLSDAYLGVRGSARDYQQAIDDANESAKEHGKNLNIDTEAGRDNEAALDGIAQSAKDLAKAQFEMNQTAGESNATLADARQKYIDAAEAMGMLPEEAEKAADAAGLVGDAYSDIPADVTTTITADSAPAQAELDTWNRKVEDYNLGTVDATLTLDTSSALISADEANTKIQEMSDGAYTVYITGDASDLDTKADGAMLQLAYVQSQRADPELGINDSQFVGMMSAATTRLDEIDKMTPTPELMAEKAILERVVTEGQDRIDGMHGKEVDVTAQANGFAGIDALKAAVDAVKSKTVTVTVKSDGSVNGQQYGMGSQYGRAMGGPIYGPGTGTSDSVPIRASAGEHMLTAREVALAGGHDAIYRMRAAIRAGAARFAGGGEIGGVPPRMTPASWTDPRLVAALARPEVSARTAPYIGTLNVPPVEGQSPAEQGQFIAGYLGTRFDL